MRWCRRSDAELSGREGTFKQLQTATLCNEGGDIPDGGECCRIPGNRADVVDGDSFSCWERVSAFDAAASTCSIY